MPEIRRKIARKSALLDSKYDNSSRHEKTAKVESLAAARKQYQEKRNIYISSPKLSESKPLY